MNLFIKRKQTHRHKKTNLWLPKERGYGAINWKLNINICILYKQIHSKGLLYSTENYI